MVVVVAVGGQKQREREKEREREGKGGGESTQEREGERVSKKGRERGPSFSGADRGGDGREDEFEARGVRDRRVHRVEERR